MPWFKTNLEGPQLDGNILKADVAQETVLEFVPPKIQLGTPKAALEYIERSRVKSDFIMAEPLKQQTGVDEIELMNEDEKIELKVLQKLKDIQESAYKEAYQLGLDDGRKLSFEKNMTHLEAQLQVFEQFLQLVSVMKIELFKQNEKHLIELVYKIATKVCARELKDNHEALIPIVQQVLATAAEQERVVVKISEEQQTFIQDVLKHQAKTFAEYPNVQFQADSSIQSGGCIVETNYSTIDATLESRLDVVWNQLQAQMPVSKPKLVS